MSTDFEKVRQDHPLSTVIGKYVALHRAGGGNRLVGQCPFHDELDASFSVDDARDHAHCFGCQWHGDVIDFICQMEDCSIPAAVELITGEIAERKALSSSGTSYKQDSVPRGTRVEVRPVIPVPTNTAPVLTAGCEPRILNPNSGLTKQWGKLSAVYPYYLREPEQLTRLLGYVIRVDKEDGGKLTPQVMWCKHGEGQLGDWTLQAFPEPRPLYFLWSSTRLTEEKAPVLLVEGEKAADAAHELLSDQYAIATWPGGAMATRYANWGLLANRSVTLWPDADPGGYAAMRDVGERLVKLGCDVRVIAVDRADVQLKGWDLADALADGWDRKRVLEFGRGLATPWLQWGGPEQEGDDSQAPPDAAPSPNTRRTTSRKDTPKKASKPPKKKAAKKEPKKPQDWPFTILGYYGDTRFYLINETQQVKALRDNVHSSKELLTMAPWAVWYSHFGEDGKVKWQSAHNYLLREGAKAGLFDSSRIRGRGAWLDGTTPIFHEGSKVWVNGECHPPLEAPGWHIYPRKLPLGISLGDAATTQEVQQLLGLMMELSWENPDSAWLLSGWILIAPVCGVLPWRPHLWITGGAGTGKTTVLRLVEKALGPVALSADGNTTEAALRQALESDARPVLLDEAEAVDDAGDGRRMANVLNLIRIGSTGGKIMKGTPGGKHLEFVVRTCFCLSAINPATSRTADESRISHLSLVQNTEEGRREWFKDFVMRSSKLLTPEFASRMLVRTIGLLPVLSEAIKICTDVVTGELGDRRTGDHIGTLLAGAWLCDHNTAPNEDDVRAYIRNNTKLKSDFTAIGKLTDSERCLQYILTIREEVEVLGGKGMRRRPLGELAQTVYTQSAVSDVLPTEATIALRRNGMGIDRSTGELCVANQHGELSKKMKDSEWRKDWGRTLKRLDGAKRLDVVRFEDHRSRGTRIPSKHWAGKYDEGE